MAKESCGASGLNPNTQKPSFPCPKIDTKLDGPSAARMPGSDWHPNMQSVFHMRADGYAPRFSETGTLRQILEQTYAPMFGLCQIFHTEACVAAAHTPLFERELMAGIETARTILLAGQGGEHHVGGVQGVNVIGRERRALAALHDRQIGIVHVHHHPLQHCRHDVLILHAHSQAKGQSQRQ